MHKTSYDSLTTDKPSKEDAQPVAAVDKPVVSVESLFATIDFAADVPWVRKLFSWFSGGPELSHRYTAYVFGQGGEGKSRIVRAIVRNMNVFESRLTEPAAFDGYDSDYDVLLVEDVNWHVFENTLRSTLPSIMARQPAVVQRKFRPQQTVANDMVLTIFTSNYKLPTDKAFRRRTHKVYANEQACEDCVRTTTDDGSGDDDAQYVEPWLPNCANRRTYGRPQGVVKGRKQPRKRQHESDDDDY